MKTGRSLAGLILAAGESRRMGQDKSLLEYRGTSFLESIVDKLRAARVGESVVVLGHHAGEISERVNLDSARVVINREYQRGQTSSLQTGLRALDAHVTGVILWLVDHPAVSIETLRQLIASFEQGDGAVVVPTFQGDRGHPVLIGRELFPRLLALEPEEPVNRAIRSYHDRTQFIAVDDPGILLDIDDPAAYERLTASCSGDL